MGDLLSFASNVVLVFAGVLLVTATYPLNGYGQDFTPEIKPLVRVLETKKLAEERENACQLTEARSLYVSAGKSVKDVSEASFAGACAGVTQAEIDKRIVEVDQRQKAINRESKKVQESLKRGEAETAFTMWQANGGPACDPELGTKVQAVRNRAFELTAQGDSEEDPKHRLQVYLDASHLNNQQPGLFQKLSQTRQQVAQIPCNACRTAGKTVPTVSGARYAGPEHLDLSVGIDGVHYSALPYSCGTLRFQRMASLSCSEISKQSHLQSFTIGRKRKTQFRWPS